MGEYSAISFNNSEDLVNQAEYEDDEGCEVPGELARLLQQEERAILPQWWFGKQDVSLSGNQSVTNAGETEKLPG